MDFGNLGDSLVNLAVGIEIVRKEHLGERTADDKLNPGYEHVRKVARVRTITILTQLDARRVGYVFAFLREAGLMLRRSDISVVSLKSADLREVKCSRANRREADLSEADLSDAKAIPGQLKKAKSLEDATMPDKSINPW